MPPPLAGPPNGEMALGVSSKAGLASAKRGQVGPGSFYAGVPELFEHQSPCPQPFPHADPFFTSEFEHNRTCAAAAGGRPPASSQEGVNDFGALAVGEGHGPAVAVEGERFVVEAKQPQQGGVVVEVVDDIFDRLVTPFVGLAMDVT